MKIVVLQEDLYGYLQYVVKRFANDGIDPAEGLALYHLNQAIAAAKTIEDGQAVPVATTPTENAEGRV